MKIGTLTIGQSPRKDVIPEMLEVLGRNVDIIEKGALDELSLEEVMKLHPETTDSTIVTRLRDGTEVKIAKKHVIPRLKSCVLELEENGVEIIILLCTGEFPEIESRKILLRPNMIIQNIVKGILKKGRLGVIIPSPDQILRMKERWVSTHFEVVFESVSPYTTTNEEIVEKAKKMKNFDMDIIILNSIGFNRKTKAIFRDITGKPVLLPRTTIARITKEMIEGNLGGAKKR